MNWKYILTVVILAAVVGGGIFGWQYWSAPKEEALPSGGGVSDGPIDPLGEYEFQLSPPEEWECYEVQKAIGTVELSLYRGMQCVPIGEGWQNRPFNISITFLKSEQRNRYSSVGEGIEELASVRNMVSQKEILLDGEIALREESRWQDFEIVFYSDSVYLIHNGIFYVLKYETDEEDYSGLDIFNQIISTFRFLEEKVGESGEKVTPPLSLPTTCIDKQEGVPVITSLSSNSGPVGVKFEIRGCNFSGFEGDKNAWIENTQGVKGLLYGEVGSTDKLLKVTLKSALCQTDTSYSGLPCREWLVLIPGVYKIYIMPLGKKSNEANFSITAGDALSLKVYFPNSKVKQVNLCNETLAVNRIIPKTEKIATAALNELLKGPTSEERIAGYTSDIPTGSKFNSLAIINGEAQVDFNDIIESGGGSCSMLMRTAQIRETLLQFATVKTVKLSINGRTEDIFQP